MFFLPETHNKHLPATLEEGEKFGQPNVDMTSASTKF